MSEPTDRPAWLARVAALDLRWAVLAVVTTVGVFAFVVSYSHIYDLGRANAQSGTAARLLPLSVDGLIVAATMVMFIAAGAGRALDWRARWMPRLTLYAAIGATVAANVAYGLPHGWRAAVVSGWPGGAFVAAVELGIIVVRLAPQTRSQNEKPATVPAAKPQVPASAADAAAMAYAASVAGGNPLPARQLMARYGIKRGEADRIVKSPPAGPAPGASSPDPAGASCGQGGKSAVDPRRRAEHGSRPEPRPAGVASPQFQAAPAGATPDGPFPGAGRPAASVNGQAAGG